MYLYSYQATPSLTCWVFALHEVIKFRTLFIMTVFKVTPVLYWWKIPYCKVPSFDWVFFLIKKEKAYLLQNFQIYSVFEQRVTLLIPNYVNKTNKMYSFYIYLFYKLYIHWSQPENQSSWTHLHDFVQSCEYSKQRKLLLMNGTIFRNM